MAERKRIGVPISGLDRSTPDHSVVDGKCETLQNLRYTGDAWRNVKGFENFDYSLMFDHQKLDDPHFARIIYKHLDYYLVYTIEQDREHYMNKHCLYATRYNDSDTVFETPILIISKDIPYTAEDNGLNIHITNLFHFGKIIHFEWDDDKEHQWYLLTEGKYVLYQIDDIYFEISEIVQTDIPVREEIDSPAGIRIEGSPSEGGAQLYDYVVRAVDLSNYQTLLRTFSNDEAWRGSICYFLAARAEDGSILAQSPLRILSSSSAILPAYQNSEGTIFTGSQTAAGLGTYNLGGRLYGGINCGGGLEPFDNLSDTKKTEILATSTSASTMYIKPTVSFNVKDTIGEFSANIFDIALYCTRIHPLFTVDSMARALPGTASIPTLNNYVSARDAYQEEDLPNEPFFLAAKKTVAELKTIYNGCSGEFLLDRAVLEHIESKGALYAPEQSEHDISSTRRKDINNSLHLFGDITTRFRKVYNRETEMAKFQKPANYTPDNQNEWENTPQLKYAQVLIKAQETLFQTPLAEMQISNLTHPLFYQCGRIISYPDYRAFEMLFAEAENSDVDNTFKATRYQLKSAPGINYAYYIPPYGGTETAPGANLKYPTIWPFREAGYEIYELNARPTTMITKGKVWASKNNNPTALPFDRSYTIGSADNEILAINSVAIEMSDAKFGEFPVYVFTKEGIFAMQSGKETLYSAIIPINYDVIINPNTLAVNGAVLYFTDKGLHALTNQGAKLLSAPIHTTENRIPGWMYTTQMVYLPEWNEVLCTDLPNKKAYVYSLDNGVWSTRDIPEGYILNNDELVATRNENIYNLRNEKEQGSDGIAISLATRPIKLGSMELKRAETIIVRFECATEQTLNVKVEGSIDTQNWGELRNIQTTTNKDIVIRRTPCSVKYLRFTISGNVTDDIRILAFEVEYYNRMRHRMR